MRIPTGFCLHRGCGADREFAYNGYCILSLRIFLDERIPGHFRVTHENEKKKRKDNNKEEEENINAWRGRVNQTLGIFFCRGLFLSFLFRASSHFPPLLPRALSLFVLIFSAAYTLTSRN